MTRLLGLTGATMILLVPLAAHADAANDPCMGLNAGDPCVTIDNKAGVCTQDGAYLDCVANTTSGTGGAGGAATGGAGGTAGATAGPGATTGPGATSGGGSNTTGGDPEDDSGCSMSQGRDARPPALAGLAAIALGVFLARRRRNRA